MIADGLGTLIGAVLGSPFGTVIYIGHPVHKRVGAQTGYSIMNGCIYLVLALSGIIPVVLSLIPAIAVCALPYFLDQVVPVVHCLFSQTYYFFFNRLDRLFSFLV